jgi:16S rRNA (uracil1498-N3)-methyltransferase
MARFYLPKDKLRDHRGTLDGRELAHLRKVLRLAPGDRVIVFDDSGREHEAVIRRLSAVEGEIEILRSYEAGRESPLQLTLAVGLTKGDKMDLVIEKATELGVHAIAPFTSAFSVPKLNDQKFAARRQRWEKIALSAVKQCGRTRAPDILPLVDFEGLVEREWPAALKLLFWEREEKRSVDQAHAAHGGAVSLVVAVGPEGGFSAEEAALAVARGFEPVHLGRRILRAETAAVVAVSLVQLLWGDLRAT